MRIAIVGLLCFGCANHETGATTDGGVVSTMDAGGGSNQTPAGTRDVSGYGDTVFTDGAQSDNAFFQALGTNGRACATCHGAASGWSITPAELQARFTQSQGMDPIFRPVDGAVAPNADVSTLQARQAAYALLLQRGVIRVGLAIPAGAEFTLTAVDDPYHYASAAELSLFRRPLPSTNLRFESTVMWDGRETSLQQQATDATLGHAQAMQAPSDDMASIVAFETTLYTAQTYDNGAGDLTDGANGGPAKLVDQTVNAGQMTLYQAWVNSSNARRASIARGEQIFNTHHFQIQGVAGFPDQQGTCSTCHDTSNIGNHSVSLELDIGIAGGPQPPPGLPRYTLTNSVTNATIVTTDPGLALTTGKWADISRFKVPSLRGVVMRPPYFHNALAPTLDDVLQFYQRRFNVQLSPQDHADLVGFLQAL